MIFEIELSVRFGDMDALGHVNNAVYNTYFEEARIQMMSQLGLMRDLSVSPLGWILARIEIDYRAMTVYGDRVIVTAEVEKLGNSSFTLRQQVLHARDRRLLADARAVQVCLDYSTQRPAPIPPAWRAKLMPGG